MHEDETVNRLNENTRPTSMHEDETVLYANLMTPNDWVCSHLTNTIASIKLNGTTSRTDLDSHANMFVAGGDVLVTARSGQTASVQGYSSDLPTRELPLVDCAMLYQCPYQNTKYILYARDALHVPNMDHNLVPPFMLREAGVRVETTPKIHHDDPDESTHSLYFEDVDLRIPLSLHGIFSYFPTSKPSDNDLRDIDMPVLMLTPLGPWRPQSTHYAQNEDSMLDWNGQMFEPAIRQRLLIDMSETSEEDEMQSSLNISQIELKHVLQNAELIADGWTDHPTTLPAYDITRPRNRYCISLMTVSSLDATLELKGHLSYACSSIGATVPRVLNTLF